MYTLSSRQTGRSRQSRLTRHRPHRAYLEALEDRNLLSVVGYTPANFNSLSGTYDSSFPTKQLWFVNVATATLDQIDTSNGTVAESLDVSNAGVPQNTQVIPNSLVFNSANGHFYFIDVGYSEPDYLSNGDTGSIVEVDPDHPTDLIIHSLPATNTFNESPIQLTVDGDGAIWFACTGGGSSTSLVSAIGHMDLSGNMKFATFNDYDPALDDSSAQSISAVGSSSVWVGMRLLDSSDRVGSSHVGAASWDTSTQQIIITAAYDLDTPLGILSDVVTDPTDPTGQSLWFTLSNTSGTTFRSSQPQDQIVHGTVSGPNVLMQQEFVVPALGTGTPPLAIQSLSLDGQGRAWFVENEGNRVGYLTIPTIANPTGTITQLDLPDSTTSPVAVVPSTTANEAWLVNGLIGSGDTLLKATADAEFAGAGSILHKPEDVSIGTGVLIATFTAAPGTYTATIDWDDSTTSTGTVVDVGGGNFEVRASGKVYHAQGNYAGTVTVKTSTNAVAGTIGFCAMINDTPLNVNHQDVGLLGRIAAVVAQFTDDTDSAASQFTATINWGDNTSSRGIIVRDPCQPGHYFVLAAHLYTHKGTYTISTSVTTTESDASVLHGSVSTTVVVH